MQRSTSRARRRKEEKKINRENMSRFERATNEFSLRIFLLLRLSFLVSTRLPSRDMLKANSARLFLLLFRRRKRNVDVCHD